MGIVRSTFIISPDGKIAHRWSSVRVKGHVEKVKERLSELISNREALDTLRGGKSLLAFSGGVGLILASYF